MKFLVNIRYTLIVQMHKTNEIATHWDGIACWNHIGAILNLHFDFQHFVYCLGNQVVARSQQGTDWEQNFDHSFILKEQGGKRGGTHGD